MAESSKAPLLNQMINTAREICEFPECKDISWKRLYDDIVSKAEICRILFEELKNIQIVLDEDLVKAALVSLKKGKKALKFAKELLRCVNRASEIYKAQQHEKLNEDFHIVAELFKKALNEFSYDNRFSISEEVQEQIQLVLAQERIMFSPDQQFQTDLHSALQETAPHPSVLGRLSEKLQLRTINDLKNEALGLHELLLFWKGIRDDWFVQVSLLLKRLKTYVLTENPTTDISESDQRFLEHSSPVIPYEYMCPISRELMEDPVIVSAGLPTQQTYERTQIKKWMDGEAPGRNYCPMTREPLSQEAIIPNDEVKTKISIWSENNNRQASDALLQKLATGNPEEQRVEAILWLFELLSSTNHLSQAHALKTLRNLSVEGNIMKVASRSTA